MTLQKSIMATPFCITVCRHWSIILSSVFSALLRKSCNKKQESRSVFKNTWLICTTMAIIPPCGVLVPYSVKAVTQFSTPSESIAYLRGVKNKKPGNISKRKITYFRIKRILTSYLAVSISVGRKRASGTRIVRTLPVIGSLTGLTLRSIPEGPEIPFLGCRT